MENEHQSQSEPKKNEAPSDPNLRERVQRLSEKVSDLHETLDEVNETLDDKP